MGVTALLFDADAAMAAIKRWTDLVLDGFYQPQQIRRGRRNASASSQRQVSVISLLTAPEDFGWTDFEIKSKQRNLLHVIVAKTAEGLYSLGVLANPTPANYLALPGDTDLVIRSGLRSAVDALLLPVTTADVTTSEGPGFSIQGNVAGVWLALKVLAEPVADAIDVVVIDDTVRQQSVNSARWPIRIIIDDVRPSAPGSGQSAVTASASFVQRKLLAFSVPVVNGSAVEYLGDILEEAGLAVLEVGAPTVADYQQGPAGAVVWHERAMIDVVFQVRPGLAYDVPTIETFEVPAVQVEE